jgi:putative aldouronate transport system permease protein
MKATVGEKAFAVVNTVALAAVSLLVLYPVVYIVSASFSSGDALFSGKVFLFPVDLTLASYRRILADSSIWLGYANTIFYTAAGTAVNMFFTVCGAYPLSKSRLMWGRAINKFVVFTMWFNPGMIPFYLTLKEYGMLDSRFAIIIAFAINTFNVVILKSFFASTPREIEEAAVVDGANDLQILWEIFLPLSMSALATVALFYAVSRWNGYFWAMLIFESDAKMPLQVLLKKMIVDADSMSEYSSIEQGVK